MAVIPLRDGTPWACATCGRWVPPAARLYTDEGLFHTAVECLSDARFEELVLRYACVCEQVSPHVMAVSL